MKYKITYKLPPDPKLHVRYYTALNKETAEYMFQETVTDGSLIGTEPLIVGIYKFRSVGWEKVT